MICDAEYVQASGYPEQCCPPSVGPVKQGQERPQQQRIARRMRTRHHGFGPERAAESESQGAGCRRRARSAEVADQKHAEGDGEGSEERRHQVESRRG